VINGQRKILLKCKFGTTFLVWLPEVEGSNFTNTSTFLEPSGVFDTYGTRAVQRAVSRPLIRKIHEVTTQIQKSTAGGPPRCR